ncbi:hypothetical protein FRC19_011109 [Serendipita sp. 401]|nr:hypothetical protein FRC19_011109 [Serendipita sp. 401]
MSHNVPGFQSGNLDRRMPVRNKVETNKELSELGNSHDRNVISNTSSEAPANDKFVFATKMLPLFADE